MQTKKLTMRIRTLVVVAILLIWINPNFCRAQKIKEGIQYKFNMQRCLNSDTLVWYGWDFSNLKVCDRNAYGYMVKDEYIPIWFDKMHRMAPVRKVRREIGKPNFQSDLKSIQDLYKSINGSDFETTANFSIPIDSLKLIVKGYDLPQKNGIGFVIVVESMNKPERYVSGYLTFFDLATRELLWATKMKGEPGGKWGVELFYRNGLIELYDYFMGKYYNRSLKKARKEYH